MKIETTKERLDTALGAAVRATTRQATLPVLACVILEARDGTLTIRATNLELGVATLVPVKMEAPGTLAVPGLLLQSLIGGLPPQSLVRLASEQGNMVVTSGGRRAVVKGMPHDEFPILPMLSRDGALRIPAKELLLGLRAVSYSAASSGLKPELMSVFISFEDGTALCAATDAFRLAEKRLRLPEDTHTSLGHILLPYKNVVEIMRILDGLSSDVEVVVEGNQLGMHGDGVYITSRLVDAVFPDYRQIIPKVYTTEVTVLKHDLLNALKGVVVFSDKFHQVRMRINPDTKQFELSTKNADVGESVEAILATSTGEDLDIAFNYRYLADCFQSIVEESVVLRFGGVGKPLVIRGVTDDSFTYLAMPMNT